jgi:tetratricopeptide (TPR) repeat protein
MFRGNTILINFFDSISDKRCGGLERNERTVFFLAERRLVLCGKKKTGLDFVLDFFVSFFHQGKNEKNNRGQNKPSPHRNPCKTASVQSNRLVIGNPLGYNRFRAAAIFVFIASLIGSVGCGTGSKKHQDLSTDTTMSLIVREWSKKINEYPDNDEYYLERALALTKDHQYDLALNDIDEAITIQPSNVAYYLQKGDILFAANKTKGALEAYKLALKKFPRNEEALYKIGQFNLFVKKYPEAERNLRDLVRLNNSRADAFFLLGTVYKEMNDTVKALKEYLNCITVDPDFYNSYIQMGILLSEKNDTNAVAYFTNALRIDEFSDEAYYGRGLMYQKMGKTKLAVHDYRKTADINPTHKMAYYNIGNINAELGKYDMALEQFQIAVKFAPEFSNAWNRIAQIYELKGEYGKSKKYYEKCLQIDPNFQLAKEGLDRIVKRNKT